MKTAVSIPDPVYKAAERLAGRLGLTRSELYARAVTWYIKENHGKGITEILNEIYGEDDTQGLDPVVQEMQLNSLEEESW